MLTHPELERCGVEHGFGLRGNLPLDGVLRPRQVHGAGVVEADACHATPLPEADAIVSVRAGQRIGIVTADCVPILLANASGTAVAAVHAGWRGLAVGVIGAAVEALRRVAGEELELHAAIGPHIGPCCYEIDTPVLDALAAFGAALEKAVRRTRPGHACLDLGALSVDALQSAGVAPRRVGVLRDGCTRCDASRFHSYRRDGPGAGRLLHHVAACPRGGGAESS